MAFKDEEGTYYSCGRKDAQYKVQGFKVELGDIEQHARHFLKKGNTAAGVHRNEKGLLDIHLYTDQPEADLVGLTEHLKKQLPDYMQPRSIQALKKLPLTLSGKIDRPGLSRIFQGDDFDFITDEEMAGRISRNLFDVYRVAAACVGKSVWKEEALEGVDVYPASWPRTLFGVPAINQLDGVVAAMRQKELPPRLILRRPVHSEPLYVELERLGFRQMMTWPGMAIDLLNNSFTKSDGVVSLVADEVSLQEWLSIVNKVLFVSRPLDFGVTQAMMLSGRFLFYGLSANGELASAALGYILDRGFGIYMVATTEKHRRRGFAKALTLHMLQDARERSCRAAYLEASEMGAPLYRQIGFGTYCDFDIFWLLGAF